MRKKITILEDDRDIREICTYFFTSEGFDVHSFGCVSDLIASPIPETDLFLLDIRLPDGNGLEFCHKLKNELQYEGVPIIMMSADLDLCPSKGNCKAEHFIAKPFDLGKLLRKVDALTGSRSHN